MQESLEQTILDYLNHPGYKPTKRDNLPRKLKLPDNQLPEFEQTVDRLVESGKIRQGKKGRLRPLASTSHLVGTIRRISSGAAFLIPHPQGDQPSPGDIFIAPGDLLDAHTGDEAVVRLLNRRRGGGKRCGRVEEIITRATSTFVGRYFDREGQGYVQIDGQNIAEPVLVGDPGAKGARPGDIVVVEMIRFPKQFQKGEAVLTKILGPRGAPGVDTLSIIHEFGLPNEFPEHVLAETRDVVSQYSETEEIPQRLDLTKETIITIDPVDARDFDDAISLSRNEDGGWRLGVHIADVAHFVQPGSALDHEARLRGTSVYLPGQVIPMLPEVLSNGLASLQKGKNRLTKSVFIEYTADGIPVHTEFANSVICVSRRFAYEEVLPLIRDSQRKAPGVTAKVRGLLERMYELAMLLRARRFTQGALELNLAEVAIDMDEDGKVTGAHEVVHDESHQIIEEFMLAANLAVAQELRDRKTAFLRRVHGSPSPLKLKNFSQFASALGYPIRNPESRSELQNLVKRVAGTPVERALNYALLRSMKQAEYSPQDMGHYALAADHYCHFTSPIRRYPDLTVHRIFDRLVRSQKTGVAVDAGELEKLARHCSITERRAASAERELKKVKLLAHMAGRLGETQEAVITGVESFGIFCQLLEVPVEGMIHISALDSDDFFDHDSATYSVTGRRSGRVYRLGDHIFVSVVHVDVARRILELKIAPAGERSRGSKPAPRSEKTPSTRQPGKRKSASSNRKESDAPRQKKRSGSGQRGRTTTNETPNKRKTRKRKRK